MDKQSALNIVKDILPRHRFEHTQRVISQAVELAEIFGADIDKTEYAAILHDVAKYFDKEDMYEIINTNPEIPNELLNYHISLWHGPAGAVYARKNCGILDQDVLNAITYHTTGRSGMSLLEKVIFLADYIEPGRNFPGVDEVRAKAKNDLDQAVCQALVNTITFLLSKGAQVHPDTVDAYNDLIKAKEELA